MASLKIVELSSADVFEDMVRVHQSHRPDIPAGRILWMKHDRYRRLLAARGSHNNVRGQAAIDLKTRRELHIPKYGEVAEITFERASWAWAIVWACSASNPIARIASWLGLVSVALGLLGVALGVLSLWLTLAQPGAKERPPPSPSACTSSMAPIPPTGEARCPPNSK